MKKTIYVLIVMLFITALGHSQTAFAATCGEIDPITNTVVTCGAGSPESVVNVWGTKNSDLPHILQGKTATLTNGSTYTCPAWFPMYCVDISGTSWFRNR
jgi:hypothetical protein